MVTPAAGREAVAHLRGGFAMSERRACRVVAVDRSSVRYRHRRCDDNRLRERLKALAEERRRFGYRRLWVLLRREGHTVNRKRVYRLYKQERLMVRRRGGRKRAIGVRSPMPLPEAPNQRWSLDFVHDQMTDGRRLRILTAPESPKGDSHSSSSHSGLLRRASGWVAPPHPRATPRLSSRTPSRGIYPLSRHHPQRRHKPEKPRFLALAIRNIAPLLRNVLRIGGRELRRNPRLLRCGGSARRYGFVENKTTPLRPRLLCSGRCRRAREWAQDIRPGDHRRNRGFVRAGRCHTPSRRDQAIRRAACALSCGIPGRGSFGPLRCLPEHVAVFSKQNE